MSIPAYLILGTPTSGRCGIAANVIQDALDDDDFCTVFVSENESETDFDRQIAAAPNAGFVRYFDMDDAREKVASLDGKKITHVFFIGDSRSEIADIIEDFKTIVDDGKIRLARVWSVFDCSMLAKFPEATRSYADELSHFADCVLLSRRAGASNREVADIRGRFEKLCRPHMFVDVDKKFRVARPVDLLIEETRRISMYFDAFDPAEELELDEDNLPDEPFNLERKPDPYIQRLQGGMRAKPVPNPAEYALKARKMESEK